MAGEAAAAPSEGRRDHMSRIPRVFFCLAALPALLFGTSVLLAEQGRGGRGFSLVQEYPDDPNTVIQALSGFRVEIVATADRPTQGSWISLTEDDQGRLILGAN